MVGYNKAAEVSENVISSITGGLKGLGISEQELPSVDSGKLEGGNFFGRIDDAIGSVAKGSEDIWVTLDELVNGSGKQQGSALYSVLEAMRWNSEHKDSPLPLEPYKTEDGSYGVRLDDDALADYGWQKDAETGMLSPKGLQKFGLNDPRPDYVRYASEEHMIGEIGSYDPDKARDYYIGIGIMRKEPYGKDFNIIAVPGVLTDGNGHYYDAHDLPEGLEWDGKTKAPDVAEGYVITPTGECMTMEDAEAKYDRNMFWTMDEDGKFTNKFTGESWEYDKNDANFTALVESSKGIDGKDTLPYGIKINPEPILDGDGFEFTPREGGQTPLVPVQPNMPSWRDFSPKPDTLQPDVTKPERPEAPKIGPKRVDYLLTAVSETSTSDDKEYEG